ncbi:MAG: hypothetical protein IJD92_04875 [Bacilli bacterium]|nr:hypothetical protein [Bacilli bacterium]
MPNGKDALIDYLKICLEKEKNSSKDLKSIKKINNLLDVINDKRYIVDFKLIEELIRKYETSDIDSILYDIMLNVNRYNNYLMNKNVKYADPILDKDIEFEEFDVDSVDISDILKSLEINELDKDLEYDLKKYIRNEDNKKKLVDFASRLKTNDDGEVSQERVVYDRLGDKNNLISILMYSDINLVRAVINKLNDIGVSVLKVLNNLPSIFIAVSDGKAKYGVPANYDKFMGNIATLESYGVDIKTIINSCPNYLINDVNKNKEDLKKLDNMGIKVKNILENVVKIFSINPQVIINNIEVLNKYGIELTDDDNNYGYRILGMQYLDKKIEYLISNNIWTQDNNKMLDNIDLLYGLLIKLSYMNWKNNLELKKSKNDGIVDNVPFEEEQIELGENEDVSRVPKRV